MFSGQWAFRHRGILVNLPLVVALFWRHEQVSNPALNWAFGIALLLAGMAVRIWAQSYIRHRLKMPLELTTGGPYQLARNPLYIGNVLICVSATFLAELPWFAPVVLLWCAALYSIVVRYEEGFLLNHYGAPYERYMKEVPRWFPSFAGRTRISWWNEFSGKAVRAELHCLLIALIFGVKVIAESPAWHVTWSGLRARLFS